MTKRQIIERFFRDDSGQTLVEFVLLIAVSIGVLVMLKSSIRGLTVRIWVGLAKRIAAPCHAISKCAPGAEFDI